MKNLLWLFAIALLIFAGCKNGPKGPTDGAQLSPPIVEPELYACATSVTVKGFVPGADIKIYANGVNLIGGGVSDSPWGQSFTVNPELVHGNKITATQTFAGTTSDPSTEVPVLSHRKLFPNGMPKPVLAKPIHDCGGAISVTNLLKGGLLKVYADGGEIGSAAGCGEGQWLSVSPKFSTGQSITADETLCANPGPPSDPEIVIPAPATLPQLQMEDVYENGKFCVVRNIINGAVVKVYNGAVKISDHAYPGGGQVVRLSPQPAVGDVLTATQELCGAPSDPSDPNPVKPCSELPAPKMGPVCPGDLTVKIIETVPGSRIKIYKDGTLAADGGGPEIVLFNPAKAGENYWATQSLDACVSPVSVAIAVGCDPPVIMKPRIPNAGRAVSVAVNPLDDNNIVVASETGGLFRSNDKGQNWTHISGSTTFRYTDVTYLSFEKGVILASAREDTRTQSGGGLWRSTDGGTSWNRIEFTTPVANCFKDISGYVLSVDEANQRVWLGTSCGLAFSDDKGLNWTYLNAATVANYNNDKTYCVETPDGNRIVILTNAGIKVSDDAGANFTTSMTGIPNRRGNGPHNQIAVAPNDHKHLYWALNYIPNGDSVWYRGLFQSLDFGGKWNPIKADKDGPNRGPFVRTSFNMKGDAKTYDLYWANGSSLFRRATADTGNTGNVSAWETMAVDHADHADVGFANDNATPILLLSDGGLHRTKDKGKNWDMAGGGPYGYNALQITEVTGQIQNDGGDPHLYFATQDNDIWASPDRGLSWPKNRHWEGFFLNIMRDYYPPDQTRLTGVSCGACGNFISKPILDGHTGFPNVKDNQGAPRLLKPKYYIQNSIPKDSTGSRFYLTDDNGGSWNLKYKFPESIMDLSKVSGALNSPVVFTAFKAAGTTPSGQQNIHIKKITGVLGAGSPIVSDVTGFGSLGVFATMFAWYKPFAVDPKDPNFIIVADIVSDLIKITTDGGATWTPDSTLSRLITANGEFDFNWKQFTQLSSIGFDPNCQEHIMIGTQQAGIFTTYNRGKTWGKMPGTEKIPFVSSFFFPAANEVIASSYGRGLWDLSFTCPDDKNQDGGADKRIAQLPEPTIYYLGTKIGLSTIKNPASMSGYGYFLLQGGQVLDFTIDRQEQMLTEVVISGGEFKGYTWDGRNLKVPFKVTVGERNGKYAGKEGLTDELQGKIQVKGILLERYAYRGAILSEKDISIEELPKQIPLGPYIIIENMVNGMPIVSGGEAIKISGQNFNPKLPLEILLNGKAIDLEYTPKINRDGSFKLRIPQYLDLGGHTLIVRQKSRKTTIQDVISFRKTVSDQEKR